MQKQLDDLKQELSTLRVQKIAGGSAAKLTRMCAHLLSYADYSATVRKAIARVYTIQTSQQRLALRKFYQDKKYLPLDLRPKQTRAQVIPI